MSHWQLLKETGPPSAGAVGNLDMSGLFVQQSLSMGGELIRQILFSWLLGLIQMMIILCRFQIPKLEGVHFIFLIFISYL